MPRVLVVDDEEFLADVVATALRYEGYETRTAGSSAQAVREVRAFDPDLVVLDVMLPDRSGVDTCRELRRLGHDTPVVFLTARDAPADRVAGLRVGGDDYVTKPFGLDELVLRVGAVLRRTTGRAPGDVLRYADLEVDTAAHAVRRAGHVVDLTPTEFALLRYLVANAGRVLSKRQILEHVWQYDFAGNDGVVQTYVSYLRRKVDAHGPPLIHTIPRVGYVLRTQPGPWRRGAGTHDDVTRRRDAPRREAGDRRAEGDTDGDPARSRGANRGPGAHDHPSGPGG